MVDGKLSDLLQTCSVKSSYQCSFGKAEGGVCISPLLYASAQGVSAVGLQDELVKHIGDTWQDQVCSHRSCCSSGSSQGMITRKGSREKEEVICFHREAMSLVGARNWCWYPCGLAFSYILQKR